MIINRNKIGAALARIRKSGRTVVFTNGCFDLLHPGHIEVLRRAAELGDCLPGRAGCLVVGLNRDRSVRRLKGNTRPLQTFRSRAAVLDAIRYVDYVVGFDEPTPYTLIRQVRPDIIVKGGDYRPADVVGADLVKKRGGRVVIVKLEKGHSTTGLIRKMEKPS